MGPKAKKSTAAKGALKNKAPNPTPTKKESASDSQDGFGLESSTRNTASVGFDFSASVELPGPTSLSDDSRSVPAAAATVAAQEATLESSLRRSRAASIAFRGKTLAEMQAHLPPALTGTDLPQSKVAPLPIPQFNEPVPKRIKTLLEQRRERREELQKKFNLEALPPMLDTSGSFFVSGNQQSISGNNNYSRLLRDVEKDIGESDDDQENESDDRRPSKAAKASISHSGSGPSQTSPTSNDDDDNSDALPTESRRKSRKSLGQSTTSIPPPPPPTDHDRFDTGFSWQKKDPMRKKQTIVDVALAHRLVCAGEDITETDELFSPTDRSRTDSRHMSVMSSSGYTRRGTVTVFSRDTAGGSDSSFDTDMFFGGGDGDNQMHTATIEESFVSLAEHNYVVNQSLNAIRRKVVQRLKKREAQRKAELEAMENEEVGHMVVPIPGVRTRFYFPSERDAIEQDPVAIRQRQIQAIVRHAVQSFQFSPLCIDVMLGRCEGSLMFKSYRIFPSIFDYEVVIEPIQLQENLAQLSQEFLTKHQIRRLLYYLCGRSLEVDMKRKSVLRRKHKQRKSKKFSSTPPTATLSAAATPRGGSASPSQRTPREVSTAGGDDSGKPEKDDRRNDRKSVNIVVEDDVEDDDFFFGDSRSVSARGSLNNSPIPEDPLDEGLANYWKSGQAPQVPKTTLQLLGLTQDRRSSASKLGAPNVAADPNDAHWKKRAVLVEEVAKRFLKLVKANAKHAFMETYYTFLPPLFRERRVRHYESVAVGEVKTGTTLIPPAITDARLRLLFDNLYLKHDVMQQRIEMAELFRERYHEIIQHSIQPSKFPLPESLNMLGGGSWGIQTSVGGGKSSSAFGATHSTVASSSRDDLGGHSPTSAAKKKTMSEAQRFGFVPPSMLQAHEDDFNPPFGLIEDFQGALPPKGKMLSNGQIFLNSVPPELAAEKGKGKKKKKVDGDSKNQSAPSSPTRPGSPGALKDDEENLEDNHQDEVLREAMKADRYDDQALYFEAFCLMLQQCPVFATHMLGVFLSHCTEFPKESEDANAPYSMEALSWYKKMKTQHNSSGGGSDARAKKHGQEPKPTTVTIEE